MKPIKLALGDRVRYDCALMDRGPGTVLRLFKNAASVKWDHKDTFPETIKFSDLRKVEE